MRSTSASQRQETTRARLATASLDGKITVWRVEDFKEIIVQQPEHGVFYEGDSYLIRHDYKREDKDVHVIYFWLGRTSSIDEKGAAALIATRMDDELGGVATQVRVVMGKEPDAFLMLFKGRMIVHQGGRASGFKNVGAVDTYDTDGVSLYHVKGTDELNTRAVQVDEMAASLISRDCFVLLTPHTIFIWQGGHANAFEMDMARVVAKRLQSQRDLVETVEFGEVPAFWDFLGGKGEYAAESVTEVEEQEPVLFQCTNKNGALDVEPIVDFGQEDLEEEDVFLLDVQTSIFLWVGREANEQEKVGALEVAASYREEQGYSSETPIITVHSGAEPLLFTSKFHAWDSKKAPSFVDPRELSRPQEQPATAVPEFLAKREQLQRRIQEKATLKQEQDRARMLQQGAALLLQGRVQRWKRRAAAAAVSADDVELVSARQVSARWLEKEEAEVEAAAALELAAAETARTPQSATKSAPAEPARASHAPGGGHEMPPNIK